MATNFFDQVYQKLFPNKEYSNNPVIEQHLIDRSESYQHDYENWKKSYKLVDAVGKVKESLMAKVKGEELTPPVHLLQSSNSNGFAISFHKDFLPAQEFQFLFDWLAEKVNQLDYKRANGDRTISEKAKHVETKEKHYLKPNQQKGDQTLLTQYFGNILIEYIKIDEKPSFIRLVANVYNDRSYKKADNFDLLAKYLLNIA